MNNETTKIENLTKLPYRLGDPLESPTIWLLTTNRCNLNCKYCYSYCAQTHEDLSPTMAVGIFNRYLKHRETIGVKHPYIHLLFFGGEPTLNAKTIFAVMDYVYKNKIICYPRLITNGIIENKLLARLIAAKLCFQISFDGFKNNLRCPKACSQNEVNNKIINTIKKVAASDLPSSIRCTIHKENVTNMSELVKFAAEHNIKSIGFTPLILEGNAANNNIQRNFIDDFVDNYLAARDTASKYGIRVTNYIGRLICYDMVAEQFQPPLFWLPDGHLVLVGRYSSSQQPGAQNAIVGKYDLATDSILMDKQKITEINNNFLANRKNLCQNCSIFSACKGWARFVDYSRNENLADQYGCELIRKLITIQEI